MEGVETVEQVMKECQNRMKKAEEALGREFHSLRTGRASTALVDGLHIDYYGSSTPLKQLATISTPEPRTITIQPWDVAAVDSIMKGIQDANIGLNPMSDGKIVRIQVPELTDERRKEITKVAKQYAEESRVSIRAARKEGNDAIKKLEKDGKISEDDSRKGLEKVQELTNQFIKVIDDLLQVKEKEIHTI